MSKNTRVCSLFCGIGGIDLAFEQAGFSIVWANDIDKDCCKTYKNNFSKANFVCEDIRKIRTEDIPEFDILTAGFPCQPFSVCGKKRGFKDERGNLFFEISRIIDAKKPKVIFIENVANLTEHNNGKTFNVIHNELAGRNYVIKYLIADACEYVNIPQHRTRIYIVAFADEQIAERFKFPQKEELTKTIKDIIDFSSRVDESFYFALGSVKYERLRKINIDDKQIYRFSDFGIQSGKDGISFTLKANMGTFPDRVPIIKDNYGLRKITPNECLALQGYPQGFIFNGISLNSAYKQCGNTVVVPFAQKIAAKIMEAYSEG